MTENKSVWTLDSLFLHFVAQLQSLEQSSVKTAATLEKRFEGVNEFRQALSDQAATFLSRNEFNAQYQSLATQMQATIERLTTLEQREAGKKEGLGAISSAILGVFVAISALTSLVSVFVSIYHFSH